MKNYLFVLFAVVAGGCTQIQTGQVGIEKNWGEVKPQALQPGLHLYNPIATSIDKFNVQEEKIEGDTACYTKDTQTATIKYTVTLFIDKTKAVEIYSTLGENWTSKLVAPIVLGHLKDTTGQYIADELIAKREAVKASVLKNLQEKLAPRGVTVTGVEFVNIDFDDAYEKAVESKVVAIQKAAEARNKTVEVEEQAKQRVIAAEAEAQAIKIQSNALSTNPALINLEAVKKWNGVLPTNMFGNSMPFINIPQQK